MPPDIQQKRIAAYKASNEVVQSLYGDSELGNIIKKISTKHSLEKSVHNMFVNLVGDVILSLQPRAALEQKLVTEMKFTAENAQSAVQDLKPSLDKIPNPNAGIPVANLESKERLVLRPDEMGKSPEQVHANSGVSARHTAPGGQTEASAKPLTRDELMSALAGKRTMASDIEAVRRAREAAKKE